MTDRFGIQIYSVHEATEKNLDSALDELKRFGYSEIEFCGDMGMKPKELRGRMEAHGLTPVSAHCWVHDFEGKYDIDRFMDFWAETGIGYIVNGWAKLENEEDLKIASERLARAFEAARKVGLRFGYHNHKNEFNTVGGEYYIDRLLSEIPGLFVELDVGWAQYAGADPCEFIRSHAESCPLLHLKQIRIDGDGSMHFSELRNGIADIAAITSAGLEAGVKHFIVEQDKSDIGAMKSAADNAAFLLGR